MFNPVIVTNKGANVPAAMKVKVSFTHIPFIIQLSSMLYFD